MARKAIKKTGKKTGKTEDIKLRVSTEDKQRFEEAAHRRGLGLSGWLRMVAIDALEAKEALTREGPALR